MQIVTNRGYSEDVRMSNVRLLIGAIIIIIALFAQFYNKKFPDNRHFLIGCIVLYPFLYLKIEFELILELAKWARGAGMGYGSKWARV